MEDEEFKKLKRLFYKIKEHQDYHDSEKEANRDGKDSYGDTQELCSMNYYFHLGHQKAFQQAIGWIYRFYKLTPDQEVSLKDGVWPNK